MIPIRSRSTLCAALCAALLGVAACDAGVPLAPDISAAARHEAPPAAAVVATFSKAFNPEETTETLLVWHGQLTLGGVTGDLVSTIDLTAPGTRMAGQTLHATVRWVVTGDLEMELETRGVVNFGNDLVRTNGRVLSGPLAGSRVHQEGTLTGLDAAGFFRINPGS